MDAAGVKVSPLAKKLGVSYQAVAKVLDGRSNAFTAANNAAAAAFLGVSPDWLATGVGAQKTRPLSPLALDIARAFDRLPMERRQQMHAHLMYTIELATEPQPQAEAPAHAPSAPPPAGR